MNDIPPYFESDEHALVAGMVAGIAMRQGMNVSLEVIDGNYTGRLKLDDPGFPPNMSVYISVDPPERND